MSGRVPTAHESCRKVGLKAGSQLGPSCHLPWRLPTLPRQGPDRVRLKKRGRNASGHRGIAISTPNSSATTEDKSYLFRLLSRRLNIGRLCLRCFCLKNALGAWMFTSSGILTYSRHMMAWDFCFRKGHASGRRHGSVPARRAEPPKWGYSYEPVPFRDRYLRVRGQLRHSRNRHRPSRRGR